MKNSIEQMSISDVMKTPEGKAMYAVIAEHFDRGLKSSPKAVADAMNERMCYIGSQAWIEGLVWQVLNKGAK